MNNNPFEETHNAWANEGGPRYGNAYENTMSMPSPVHQQNSPYVTQKMPSPSDYNAWQESNKTLEESASPQMNHQNAYQYSGTAYGNVNSSSNAYSPQVTHATPATDQTHKIEAPMTVVEEETAVSKKDRLGVPSRIR